MKLPIYCHMAPSGSRFLQLNTSVSFVCHKEDILTARFRVACATNLLMLAKISDFIYASTRAEEKNLSKKQQKNNYM
jgi:hypothetical protein